MGANVTRRAFFGIAGLTGAALIAGCSNGGASSSSASSAAAGKLTIGTLATEDLLPLWVAQEEGLFEKAGLSADIVTFQSATELIAGVSSGEVDLAMTDIMVTASMFASGTDVQMEWVTLGTTAAAGALRHHGRAQQQRQGPHRPCGRAHRRGQQHHPGIRHGQAHGGRRRARRPDHRRGAAEASRALPGHGFGRSGRRRAARHVAGARRGKRLQAYRRRHEGRQPLAVGHDRASRFRERSERDRESRS